MHNIVNLIMDDLQCKWWHVIFLVTITPRVLQLLRLHFVGLAGSPDGKLLRRQINPHWRQAKKGSYEKDETLIPSQFSLSHFCLPCSIRLSCYSYDTTKCRTTTGPQHPGRKRMVVAAPNAQVLIRFLLIFENIK
jgi:hypothetical protein